MTLSDASPLGVPFWILRDCQAEQGRRDRIAAGRPGADCPKRYLQSNTEFTDVPICMSSRTYMKRKLEHLPSEGLSQPQLDTVTEMLLSRTCVCHELGGGAIQVYEIRPYVKALICPGPNIADFSRTEIGRASGRESG